MRSTTSTSTSGCARSSTAASPPFGGEGLERTSARDLATRLLGPARRALGAHDVAADDIDRLFALLEERIATGRTGARWQRAAAAALEERLGRDRALAAMTRRYIDAMSTEAGAHLAPAVRLIDFPTRPVTVDARDVGPHALASDMKRKA